SIPARERACPIFVHCTATVLRVSHSHDNNLVLANLETENDRARLWAPSNPRAPHAERFKQRTSRFSIKRSTISGRPLSLTIPPKQRTVSSGPLSASGSANSLPPMSWSGTNLGQ